ncbi:MAG: hypothetical protein M1361_01200 [Patescibacteria group bacterium]|nr:hypothetical protein [Patescibacteria group bacterium]
MADLSEVPKAMGLRSVLVMAAHLAIIKDPYMILIIKAVQFPQSYNFIVVFPSHEMIAEAMGFEITEKRFYILAIQFADKIRLPSLVFYQSDSQQAVADAGIWARENHAPQEVLGTICNSVRVG